MQDLCRQFNDKYDIIEVLLTRARCCSLFLCIRCVWGIKNTEHKRIFPICILNYHKTSKQLTFVFWDLRSYRMTAMAKQTYCKAVKVSNTTQQSNAVSRKPYFQSIIHALTPSRTSILPNNTTDEFNMLCWFFFSQGR